MTTDPAPSVPPVPDGLADRLRAEVTEATVRGHLDAMRAAGINVCGYDGASERTRRIVADQVRGMVDLAVDALLAHPAVAAALASPPAAGASASALVEELERAERAAMLSDGDRRGYRFAIEDARRFAASPPAAPTGEPGRRERNYEASDIPLDPAVVWHVRGAINAQRCAIDCPSRKAAYQGLHCTCPVQQRQAEAAVRELHVLGYRPAPAPSGKPERRWSDLFGIDPGFTGDLAGEPAPSGETAETPEFLVEAPEHAPYADAYTLTPVGSGETAERATAGGLVPADDSDLLPNLAGDRERERRRTARVAFVRGLAAAGLLSSPAQTPEPQQRNAGVTRRVQAHQQGTEAAADRLFRRSDSPAQTPEPDAVADAYDRLLTWLTQDFVAAYPDAPNDHRVLDQFRADVSVLLDAVGTELAAAGLAASPAQTDGEREWRVTWRRTDGLVGTQTAMPSEAAARRLHDMLVADNTAPDWTVRLEYRECGPWSPVPSPETETPDGAANPYETEG